MKNNSFNTHCIALIITIAACGPISAEQAQEAAKKEPRWVLDCSGQRPAPKVAITNVCAWPNLTRLPNGDIVALIFNQPGHGNVPGDVECWASQDEGETWTRRSVAAPRGTPEQNRMNVAAGLTSEGNWILITSGWSQPGQSDTNRPDLNQVLPPWVCISKDGGRTWNIEKESFPKAPDGRELIPFGDIMTGKDGKLRVAAYRGPLDADKQEAARAAAKGDVPLIRASYGWNWVVRGDGKTWEKPLSIAHRNGHNETALLHLGEGKWLAAARRAGLTLYYSDDDAQTWKPYGPLPHGKVTANPLHPGHLTRLQDGSILLSYGNRRHPPEFTTSPGVEVMFSSDEGKSWSEPYRLLDVDSGDSGYPSSVQRKDGQVVTAYYAKGIPGHKGYHMGVVIWDPVKTRKP